MPEIRINSKPCPNCGYRNVTEESRSCERCGYSLTKVRNRRLSLGMLLIAVLLLGGGGVFYNIWKSSNPQLGGPDRQPVRNEVKPKTPEKQKKEEENKRKTTAKKYVAQTANTSEESDTEVVPSYTANNKLPAQYNNLIQGAEQLSNQLNIRVWGGNIDEFENEDLKKLADKLSSPQYLTQDLHIISFAGSVGTPFIAEKRAEFLKKVFKEKYKLPQNISIYGFGPLDDESPTGEPVIEVWAK